jgi:hypothetical protein
MFSSISWKLVLRIIAAVSWLISLAWLIAEPGYEPAITFLGGLAAFLTSFFVASQPSEKIIRGLKILIVRSRPAYLFSDREELSEKQKTRSLGFVEYKPEHYTDVQSDSSVIQRAFAENGKTPAIRIIENAEKSDLAEALTQNWDIVHFDCVVVSNKISAQLCLDDGPLSPSTFSELLNDANIKLMLLIDCDSLKMVSSSFSANVKTLVAITGSVPVLVTEKFNYGFYRSLARGRKVEKAFEDGKSLAAVELPALWDPTLFVLTGDESASFEDHM